MRRSFALGQGFAGAVLIVSAVGVVGPLGAVPASSAPSIAAKSLAWSPCFPREGRFECADLTVPLDYSHPNGPTIDIAVVRQRAADPARRIGSLLLNPGG